MVDDIHFSLKFFNRCSVTIRRSQNGKHGWRWRCLFMVDASWFSGMVGSPVYYDNPLIDHLVSLTIYIEY